MHGGRDQHFEKSFGAGELQHFGDIEEILRHLPDAYCGIDYRRPHGADGDREVRDSIRRSEEDLAAIGQFKTAEEHQPYGNHASGETGRRTSINGSKALAALLDSPGMSTAATGNIWPVENCSSGR